MVFTRNCELIEKEKEEKKKIKKGDWEKEK